MSKLPVRDKYGKVDIVQTLHSARSFTNLVFQVLTSLHAKNNSSTIDSNKKANSHKAVTQKVRHRKSCMSSNKVAFNIAPPKKNLEQ